jgi:hypothetical protein
MLRIGQYSIDVVHVYTYVQHTIVEDGQTILLNTFLGYNYTFHIALLLLFCPESTRDAGQRFLCLTFTLRQKGALATYLRSPRLCCA